jgi:Transcriptional regulator containing PAS, AAA-type ATPase, and DNA-binding domains
LREATTILEREIIHEGLIRTQGNKSLLARQLGISRSSLLAKIAEYGLPRMPEREDEGGRIRRTPVPTPKT